MFLIVNSFFLNSGILSLFLRYWTLPLKIIVALLIRRQFSLCKFRFNLVIVIEYKVKLNDLFENLRFFQSKFLLIFIEKPILLLFSLILFLNINSPLFIQLRVFQFIYANFISNWYSLFLRLDFYVIQIFSHLS